MIQRRHPPAVRRDEILTAALALAEQSSYKTISRAQIAKAVGVSEAAIQYHFHTMARLRGDLMRAAIKRECLPVIAQGLVAKDARAIRSSNAELRQRALGSII